jgi:hypothetical protein
MMRVRALMTLVALLVCGAAFGQNLLLNPGFEDVDDAGKALHWNHGRGAETITDAARAHGGERFAKGRFDDGLSQQIEIEPGASYRITGWIRRVDAEGEEVPKIKAYFLTAEGERASVAATEFHDVTAGEWLQWESMMRSPESAAVLNLTLRGFWGGSEFFYWDDLAVERIEAPDWPVWDKTPDLSGMTVTVPDLADVWTDALLRIPPGSLKPMDGRLDSAALSHGHDFRVQLREETLVNYALIHTLQPMQNLQNAQAIGIGAGGERTLFSTGEDNVLVTSERFDTTAISEMCIEIPDDATVYMSEMQLLNIAPSSGQPAGHPVTMGLASADAPAGVAEDLALARGKESDRSVLVAGEGDRGIVQLAGDAYLNVFATPREVEYGVGAVTLELALSSDTPENLIEISMMQAAELDLDIAHATASDRGADVLTRMSAEYQNPREYATIFRGLSQVGDDPLCVTFDIPDTLCAAGEPVWLTLRPKSDMRLDLAQSQVTVHTLSAEATMAEYLPRLERLLRRLHSNETEAHPFRDYQDKFMGRYIARVLELDPDNIAANLIWNHVGGRPMNVELERPGPADAPDWAVWSRLALQNLHYVPQWWLDNRQQADGQLAGHINDDGEFSDRWPADYLITADPRLQDGLQKLADVAWRMSGGKGYTVGSRDVEHAAEDQSCTQPQVLLTRYGSPRAVERLMKMSRYLDFWTAINEVGRRQFKSFMFTSDQVWGDPPDDIDQAYCPLSMVGAGHAAWYVNLPDLRRIFLEEADSWRLATESTDKGKRAGVIPHEIKFSTSEILPYMPYNKNNPVLKNRPPLYIGGGIYIIRHLLHGASWLTGDDKYAAAMALAEPTDEEKLATAASTLSQYQREVVTPQDKTWSASQSEQRLYDAWRITGDRIWLIEELKEVVRQQERTRWLATEAEPYTDRVRWAGERLLCRTFLGETTAQKSHVPGNWISWEGGGTEFAGLVVDKERDHLKVLCYSFADAAREMKMRVWRPPHGRYHVAVGIDRDNDWTADEIISERERELARFDAIEWSAQPATQYVIELRLIEELDDITSRPDLAMDPWDVRFADGAVTVTVHNIGGAATPASVAQVLDAAGSVVGEAEAPALEAPLDLQPRTAEVRIAVAGEPQDGWRVSLDPTNAIAEITEVNNTMPISTENK